MPFALHESAQEESSCDVKLVVALAIVALSHGSYPLSKVAARYPQARVAVGSIGRDLRSRVYRILTPILAWFFLVAAPESAIAEQPGVQPIIIRMRVEASSLPKDVALEAMVAMFFKQAGFTIVAAATPDYDAALEIQVKGTPLWEQYSNFGLISRHYSGAKIEGTLLLESSKTSSTKQFSGSIAPPDTIELRYGTPEKAPFGEALNESNLYVMLGGAVAEVLGVESVVAFWLGGNLSGLTQLKMMGAAAVPGLVRALGAQDITLRMAAVKSLGELGDTRAAAPLLTVLKGDKEPKVRAMAAFALAKIKHDDAVEPLIDALKASDGTFRIAAVESLGEFADKRAVRPLIAVLKEDGDPKIRHSAAQALVKMKGVAVEPLIELLKGPDLELRVTAIESLGDVGDARAVNALIDALKGERLSVRQKIAHALGKLTHQNFGVDYHAWAKWREQENKPIVEQR